MWDICTHNILVQGPSGTLKGFEYQSIRPMAEADPILVFPHGAKSSESGRS